MRHSFSYTLLHLYRISSTTLSSSHLPFKIVVVILQFLFVLFFIILFISFLLYVLYSSFFYIFCGFFIFLCFFLYLNLLFCFQFFAFKYLLTNCCCTKYNCCFGCCCNLLESCCHCNRHGLWNLQVEEERERGRRKITKVQISFILLQSLKAKNCDTQTRCWWDFIFD